MTIGEIIRFAGGHYDIRAIVDGRFVVRFRNEATGKESYRVWTVEERESFDADKAQRADRAERNNQIYERLLAGETHKALSAEFDLSPERIRQIFANQARKERRMTNGPRPAQGETSVLVDQPKA